MVMRSTQQFSITLPNEMAAEVRSKVASGEYASESEVIRDGLRALQARDKAVDQWLRNEVVPAYEAMKADPARGADLAEVRAALTERHAARTARPPKS
jgi:antitoxin ParD1/3/4